jgi:hypothetical protein
MEILIKGKFIKKKMDYKAPVELSCVAQNYISTSNLKTVKSFFQILLKAL